MTTTINTTGSLRSQDNKSIRRTMLTPNPQWPECKANSRSPKRVTGAQTSKSSLRRGKRTEQCLDSKLSMEPLPPGKSQPPRGRPQQTTTVEIPRPPDGPTASCPWPCNNRWLSKTPQVMGHMAEGLLRDKYRRATAELPQDSLSGSQAVAISPCLSPKLRQ